MNNYINSKKNLLAAAALASVVVAPVASAAGNPFSNTELVSGFNLNQPLEGQGAGGGEGKCGVDPKTCPEGKCGEGKCGEKCRGEHGDQKGDQKPADDGHKADAEGACGEGKCGAMGGTGRRE